MSRSSALRAVSALAALALALAPARTRALAEVAILDRPLRLDLTEYGAFAYHASNGNIAPPGSAAYDPTGSDYGDWLNRLELDAGWGDFSGLLRLDTSLFGNAPVAAPDDPRMQTLLRSRYANRPDLEKIAVSYTGKHLEVTAGDSYVTYGRGLVLSLRKVDELAVDTSARGANVTAKAAGLSLNGVAGVSNILNVDPATGREANDPDDLILGSRAEYRFGRYAVPGVDVAHVVYARNAQSSAAQREKITAYSATLELPYLGPYGSFYAEFAQQTRQPSQTNTPTAFYASASGYAGPATVLVEYKDYRKYQPISTSLDPLAAPELALSNYYNAPPTLERLQQLVLDNTDVAGPRARVDLSVTPSVVPFVAMGYFRQRLYDTRIYDPYGGVELHWQQGRSRAALSGGYRGERYAPEARQAGQLFEGEWHAEYEVNQVLKGPYSLELDGLHESHHDLRVGLGSYLDWQAGQAYLSFKRAASWSVAAGYEYYTEAPQSVRSRYVNASASWDVRKDLLLRLFAGGQRAGIKCVNGVCRNYPAFEGARAEIVARY